MTLTIQMIMLTTPTSILPASKRVTDQNQMIKHVLNNIDPKINDKQPYFSTSALYDDKIRCVHEEGLIIVQDFKSFDDHVCYKWFEYE
jgi:hypothetical protein